MPFLFAPAMQAVIPVWDSADFFPVRRVYGAAKNYASDIATCKEKKGFNPPVFFKVSRLHRPGTRRGNLSVADAAAHVQDSSGI